MVELREEELRQQITALKAASRPESIHREDSNSQSFWGQPFSEEINEALVPANFRELLIESFDGTQDPHAHLQAFQTQMYISGGSDRLSCKLFPGTLRGVPMQWMATLPPRSIHTFSDLARLFLSQFAANKAKKMEVADLFVIKQARGESLKGYLARFNTATVRVNDPDQKFFVKAFQKGLRIGPFSDALALRRPASMEEIRMRAEKHIEVEEDQAKRMEADHAHLKNKQVEQHHKPNHTKAAQAKHHFTPLTESKAKILKEICHTRLLKFPQEPEGKVLGRDKDEWCDFHRTRGHSTEACWTLCTQLERLVQEGRLNRYVHKRSGNSRRGTEAERWNQHLSNRGEGRRSRSRSRENILVGHRGTIATISGGLGKIRLDGVRAMDVQECQTVLTGANATPLGRRQSGLVVTFDDRDLKLGSPT
ncbi:hypothetical protein CR513_60843, partial [Mucuna pruriens]